MEKNKLLRELLSFFETEQKAGTPSVLNEEKKIIGEMLHANIEKNRVEPPAYLFSKIKELAKDKRKSKSKFSMDIFAWKPVLGISFFIFLSIGIIFYNQRHQQTTSSVNLASIQGGLINSQPGIIYKMKGMRINSAASGKITFHSGKFDNIILQEGIWDVQIEHDILEKETWFHFPGGSISPVGTAFTVEILQDNVNVTLKKGKIQIYKLIGEGGKSLSELQESPAQITFVNTRETILPDNAEKKSEMAHNSIVNLSVDHNPGAGVPDIDKTEKEIDAIEQPSIYLKYTGKDVIIVLENGDRFSGTVLKISNKQLSLKTDSGKMEIIESDMVSIEEKTKELAPETIEVEKPGK